MRECCGSMGQRWCPKQGGSHVQLLECMWRGWKTSTDGDAPFTLFILQVVAAKHRGTRCSRVAAGILCAKDARCVGIADTKQHLLGGSSARYTVSECICSCDAWQLGLVMRCM